MLGSLRDGCGVYEEGEEGLLAGFRLLMGNTLPVGQIAGKSEPGSDVAHAHEKWWVGNVNQTRKELGIGARLCSGSNPSAWLLVHLKSVAHSVKPLSLRRPVQPGAGRKFLFVFVVRRNLDQNVTGIVWQLLTHGSCIAQHSFLLCITQFILKATNALSMYCWWARKGFLCTLGFFSTV